MIKITDSTLKSILAHFEHDLNSYGFGGMYNTIVNIIKELPLEGMDLSEYYYINRIVNPPTMRDIKFFTPAKKSK